MSLDSLPADVDVAVIGGGINGASVYHELAAAGYRVLLVDRGDFAGGTSQASAMMIWGGLLYMKDWELATVARLSASRDRLIAEQPSEIRPRFIRYIPEPGGRSRAFVQFVLYAYWLLGGMRRRCPRFERDFAERRLLKAEAAGGALTYEEASLETSDARFVLSWILGAAGDGSAARNYCSLETARYDASRNVWRLDLRDTLDGGAAHVRARLVVNAAGGWTDEINRRTLIESPYRHVLSRGVSMAVEREPLHTHHLAFDNGVAGNAMSLVPWGPVALWGSTDTIHDDIEQARRIDPRDIRYLFAQLNRHLARPLGIGDVVSLRCGVRPVAVARHARIRERSCLSRRHRIHADRLRPWVTVYGGKLSGCTTVARAVLARVKERLGAGSPVGHPSVGRNFSCAAQPPVPRNFNCASHAPVGRNFSCAGTETFPGIDQPVVSPAWSAAHEQCRTLEDYLRRRTNIAQWVRRSGLGVNLEYLDRVRAIALALHGGDASRAARDVQRYRRRADEEWTLLQGVTV